MATGDGETPVAESEAAPAEIDLSSEWDDAITIEADDSVTPEAAIADAVGDHELPAQKAAAAKESAGEAHQETVEEIRFYIEHGMPQQAEAAFEKLQTLTTDEAILSPLEAEIKAASQTGSADEEVETVETVDDFSVTETSVSEQAIAEASSAEPAEFSVQEPSGDVPEIADAVEPDVPEPAPVAEMQVAPEVQPEAPEAVPSEPGHAQPPVLQEFVSDLEATLGENFLGGPVVEQPASAKTAKPKQRDVELEPIGNHPQRALERPNRSRWVPLSRIWKRRLARTFLKALQLPNPSQHLQLSPVLPSRQRQSRCQRQLSPQTAPLL